MDFLLEYSPVFSALASFLMLGVWVVYLQVFWHSYRRQHRAKVIISTGAGAGLDALCLVGNMSAEPVFIEGMILFAERGERRRACAVMNLSDTVEDASRKPRPTREGPLKSGDYITVGTFRDLIGLIDPSRGDPPEIDAIEIWMVADFSSEKDLVFARRRFLLAARGTRTVIRPAELETRRITSARERREVQEVLQDHLEEAVGGNPS